MVNLNLFETQIVWRTNVVDVLLISSKTDSTPAIYKCSVGPIDINELKGKPQVIEVGFYLKDYIGHTFKITEVNASYILVSDDFNCGECPQNSQQGVIYQSVANGDSPFLMPSFYSHLHHSALDYSRQIEIDIIWRQIPVDGNITETPIGSINGLNTIFTTNFPYKSGSIMVFVNGLNEHYFTETSDTIITLEDAPKSTGFLDIVEVIYTKK